MTRTHREMTSRCEAAKNRYGAAYRSAGEAKRIYAVIENILRETKRIQRVGKRSSGEGEGRFRMLTFFQSFTKRTLMMCSCCCSSEPLAGDSERG